MRSLARVKGKSPDAIGVLPQPVIREGSYMYVPPFEFSPEGYWPYQGGVRGFDGSRGPERTPQAAVASHSRQREFNEAGYLRHNPDMAEAIKSAKVEDARLHYVGFGILRAVVGQHLRSMRAGIYAPTRTLPPPLLPKTWNRPLSISGSLGHRKAAAPTHSLSRPRSSGRKRSLCCRALIAASDRMSNKMEDLLNYTTLLEGVEEAAIKQIAEDD